jgi:hypothetical protein
MTSSILPTDPRTGLQAIGFRKDGRPIWPIKGGSGDGDDAAADQGDDTTDGDDGDAADSADSGQDDTGDGDDTSDDGSDGADALGDKGKQALDRMKAKGKVERDKRVAAERRAAELEAELAKAKGEDEATIRQRDADQAALAKANARIVKAEVRGAAKGLLADPQDAFLHLDINEIEVGEDGEVDTDDIVERLNDLISKKPYLAAQRTPGNGAFDTGRGKPAAKKQLTRAELAALPHAERLKAVEDGRFKVG